MSHSIRVKLAILMVAFMSGTFIIYYFINTVFLESYYINEKKDTLESVYDKINKMLTDEKNTVDDDVKHSLNTMCEIYGITLLITDTGGEDEFYYGPLGILSQRLVDKIFSETTDKDKTIKKSDHYEFSIAVDPNNSSNYLEMWGDFNSGNNYFIARMAYEGMQESTKISNRFLGYVGSVTILVSCVVMLMISKTFTKPILQLSRIAVKMSNMDFNAKYTGDNLDEIGILGNSMNLLSEKLEKNISELKSANNELTKDLARRTEQDEMRKEFLSNVSHELKSPIALIQGYAEGLKESVNDDPESRDFYCDVIMDEAGKMNNIVKKLLTLNQIEFGNNQLKMERFDIISVISGILNSAVILLKQKEVTIYFDDRIPVYVWSDEFQTEEVLMNYISNALNHVDENKIIRISVIPVDGNVRVSVFNSGMHIPGEDIDKIWEKFYKVDKARTREYGGSGIGLSIVKAIQDSLNKKYGVRNVKDGVEFWFDIDAQS